MSLTTKAIFDTYGPPEVIRLARVQTPTPPPGHVLLRTHFASINPIDCATRAGRGVAVDRFPGVLGWDVAGVVAAVGADVTALREGDQVFGMPRFPQHVGCCADHVISPASTVIPIPRGVSARQAAAAPMVTLTAWQALSEQPGSLDGSRVLVHGAAGGVGHVAVQLAKRAGAYVIATASERNWGFLTALGADETLDYAGSSFAHAIRDVDLAIDTRGGQDFRRLAESLKRGAMIVTLKGTPDQAAQSVVAARAVQWRSIMVQPDRNVLTQIGERIHDRLLNIEIEAEFPLTEIARAHAVVEAGHVRGRVILRTGAADIRE